MTDTNRYPAHVFWSDEDEGFIAVATDLPGCSAFGDTQEEALRELQDAIAAWMQAQKAAGNPLPAPSSPAREYSGKVLLRMPRSLHAKLSLTAKSEDVSLNQYILHLLSSGSERASTAFATAAHHGRSISTVGQLYIDPFSIEPSIQESTAHFSFSGGTLMALKHRRPHIAKRS